MKHESLIESVRLKNIQSYFQSIRGIQDHYAQSKLDNAVQMIQEHQLKADNCLLIGDTIHDHEVAESIGCDCILIAAGHQSRDRLESTGGVVLNEIIELKTV